MGGATTTLFSQTGFIRAHGTVLKDEAGEIFQIKGMGFSNLVYANPAEPLRNHHSEEDYQKIKEMGFNTIRFYLNYGLFESDSTPYQYKESGFSWIDQNIVWAKKHGIRLILSMNYAQGGNQSVVEDDALWTNSDNRDRLVALWGEIARRYGSEQAILGYTLLNEPIVSNSFNDYKRLLSKIVKEIRKVDRKHLLIVERAMFLREDPSENGNGNLNFVKVKDSNVLYAFHFYEPYEFTMQNAAWIDEHLSFTTFPDSNRYVLCGEEQWGREMVNSAIVNEKERINNKGWVFVESPLEQITSSKYTFAVPTFRVLNLGSTGRAWANGFKVEEFDKNKKIIKTVVFQDSIDRGGWFFWSIDQTGMGKVVEMPHKSKRSLYIEKSENNAVLGSHRFLFPLKVGNYYRVSGYVKGENLSDSSELKLGFDMYSLKGDMFPLDKSYLTFRMQRFIDWGKKNKVPLFVAEFGTISDSFTGNRGGLLWVNDILDICNENNLNFSYHNYHEENNFGIYRSSPLLPPSECYTPLLYLFKRKLSEKK